MKKYIEPIMNVTEFDYENVVTESGNIPEPEKVEATGLIETMANGKDYAATVSFTF